MTRTRTAQLLAIVFVAACGTTPPARFYTLDSTARAEGSPSAAYAVAVGPATIPAAVDRAQFVVQIAPNRVAIDDFNRWAAPLNESIARVVAGDLATLLGTPRVAKTPLANFEPDYRVSLDVQRFESGPGQAVLIDAVWIVRASAGGKPRGGRTVAHETAQGTGFDALAAAHSRALAQVSRDIAQAIRTEAETAPRR